MSPSARDTCETQRRLAAQSSRIDTIVAGKEVVYKPRSCVDAAPVASAAPARAGGA